VWVYMGPPELQPEMPGFEWLSLEPQQHHVARWLQQTNWAQGMEGEIDSSHVSWLHQEFGETGWRIAPLNVTAPIPEGTTDGAPILTVKETPYGLVYGARRDNESGLYYWRVTQWFVPMYSMIPNGEYPRSGRAWVPVDDYNVTVFNYAYCADRAFTKEEFDFLENGPSFPSPREEKVVALDDGYLIDTWVPVANKQNNYGLDRKRQKDVNYSGIEVVTDQDRALQEHMPSAFGLGPGKIVDRTREMLVPSDIPVITARRILLNMAKALQQGIEPLPPRDASLYRHLSAAGLAPEANFDDYMATLGSTRSDQK